MFVKSLFKDIPEKQNSHVDMLQKYIGRTQWNI